MNKDELSVNCSNGFFFSASDFYKSVFGKKVYKIAIDAGCSCPNRDGTKGTGGCIFCSQKGSGEFSQKKELSVSQQIENGKLLVKSKTKDNSYIAYFQNFTNTYGDSKSLIKKYYEALECKDIAGISIATRPDCISDEILEGLKLISEKNFVMLELGFQTCNEISAKYINRCYENLVYDECVLRVRKECPEIHIITHVIFGLPGETERDMLNTIKYVVDSKVHGIKISVLHVLKFTKLFDDYMAGNFKCLSMEAYFNILGKAINMIPPRMVIHRVTGDGAKYLLVAPEWTADKKKVLNAMKKNFTENNIKQGSFKLKT